MFLQMLKMTAQSIASTSSPQRKTCIRATRVFKFNQLRKWLLIAFSLKKSHTNSYTWWKDYNALPKLHKFMPICVPFQFATTYVPSLKDCFVFTLVLKCFRKFQELFLTCVTFFFIVLKLQQYPFEPQFGVCDLVIIIV